MSKKEFIELPFTQIAWTAAFESAIGRARVIVILDKTANIKNEQAIADLVHAVGQSAGMVTNDQICNAVTRQAALVEFLTANFFLSQSNDLKIK